MTVTKGVMTITSVAVALMFGGGVYLLIHLNTIAQQLTERIASETLGVSVNIGSMDIRLGEKLVLVNNVKVGNPDGYSKPHAVTIDQVSLKAHQLSDVLLQFEDVSVRGTTFFMEVTANGTNLTDLRKNVDAKAAAGDQAAKQIKVIIDQMNFENTTVKPSVILADATDLAPIVIETIRLSGVGEKENGVLASEAIAQVTKQMISRISREAGEAGFYQGVSPEALQEMGMSQFQTLKEQISTDVKTLTKDLKTIFDD